MRVLLVTLCLLFTMIQQTEASVVYHYKNNETPLDNFLEWKEENISSFQELIISWNSLRPTQGNYHIYVSVKIEENWSPWLLYAFWGKDGQLSYLENAIDAPVRTYQDAIEVQGKAEATGFKIKIISDSRSDLENLWALHVCANHSKSKATESTASDLSALELKVYGLSQMTVDHPRFADLCSPTSTTAVVRFLLDELSIDPVKMADQVWDGGFDIYGNWVFNVAQAAHLLGKNWECYVTRLSGFNDIHASLKEGMPVIVSVRGPLPRSAFPYKSGHLIAITGYDPTTQEVICMDPAFSSDSTTTVRYFLTDFMVAWERRGFVAYVFSKD